MTGSDYSQPFIEIPAAYKAVFAKSFTSPAAKFAGWCAKGGEKNRRIHGYFFF